MDYNINKICRVCLEEGALTSIYSTEFAMMPSTMLQMCAKIRVYKSDGLPAVICNNCIYRLGVAYHFKQECENSDIRLRQYLGLPDRGYGFCDVETNTDELCIALNGKLQQEGNINSDEDEDDEHNIGITKKSKRRSRYQRKPPDEHKKRGPKPQQKLPQTCYECSKTFKCLAQLQQHMRTHSGEKPYSCNYCPRRFAQKYNLKIHERIHTGTRPFQCEICSKQFSALGNFQAHQKIHTGIRDQVCPVCQKKFYSAGDLSKHMATHAGLKNHHCDVCGKAFTRQRDMHAHKRKLHALQQRQERSCEDDDDEEELATVDTVDAVGDIIDNFKCPDCDKEFVSASSLSVHFRTHGSGSNLLNLPLGGVQMPPHPHYHHASSHPHVHPLQPPIQTNSAMTHTTLAHILPPSSHPPLGSLPPVAAASQSALTMMHAAQRLHPY